MLRIMWISFSCSFSWSIGIRCWWCSASIQDLVVVVVAVVVIVLVVVIVIGVVLWKTTKTSFTLEWCWFDWILVLILITACYILCFPVVTLCLFLFTSHFFLHSVHHFISLIMTTFWPRISPNTSITFYFRKQIHRKILSQASF